MNKGILTVWAFIAGSFLFASTAYSEDLLDIYQQALHNDPVFAQARANWQSTKMNLPIAQSRYLPQLTLQSSGSRNYSEIEPISISTIRNYFWKYGYSITLQQPIFALTTWESIKEASATVKAATANYLAAQQDLMARTTEAYFEVL